MQDHHNARLRRDFVTDLRTLVQVESPTSETAACSAVLECFVDLCERRTGRRPEVMTSAGRTHALLRPSGSPNLLLLGHIDTVWPVGTLARWPFAVDDDTATGPGTFDMKAGLVMGLHALAQLAGHPGIGWLVTTDEETGAATSQSLIEHIARTVDGVLVLEPSGPGGAVKHARKGVSLFRLRITGRAAHAGLEPEKGVNALIELAAQVPKIAALADADVETTVTPTVARAGTTMNTVPAEAMCRIDVRTALAHEQQRVHEALRALTPANPAAVLEIDHIGSRKPLEPAMSAQLLKRHATVLGELGFTRPTEVISGGASDGNFTAGVGTPTLDGLGAVGGGAHAEGEHIALAGSLEGTRILAALLQDLIDDPL